MPSRKSIRDKIATHTFFRQDPDISCPLGCCSCSTSKDDGSGHRPPFTSLDPHDYHAATDEFDKISKDFKKVLAEEAKRRQANCFTMTIPDHWGMSFLESWENFADGEATQSLEEFERNKKQSRQAQETLQREGPQGPLISLPDNSKFFSLMIDMEHLNNVMFRCCQSAIFFNVEKKFGCPEEAIQDVSTPGQHAKKVRRLELKPKPEISLKERFNAPVRVMRIKDKPKKDARPRKKLPALTALAEATRQCKWLSKDVQTILKSVSDDYSWCLQLPDSIGAYGQDIPQDVPQHVRQSLWDLEFLRDQMFELHPSLMEQRDHVRSTLLIWIGSGDEIWKWGVEHIHTMPDFQKYEYMRLDMHTMYQLTFREEEKLIEFFLSQRRRSPLRSHNSTASIEAYLKVGEQTKAERQAIFDQRLVELRRSLDPVDVMVESLKKYQIDLEAEVKETVGATGWWKDLAKMTPQDIIKALQMQHKPS